MNFAILLFVSMIFSESEHCTALDNQSINSRTIYSIGDTLSFEDQTTSYDVCNGSGNYQTGDSFSFIDLNGDQNGGNYKITLISMNATW
jgi:hypothetical protein